MAERKPIPPRKAGKDRREAPRIVSQKLRQTLSVLALKAFQLVKGCRRCVPWLCGRRFRGNPRQIPQPPCRARPLDARSSAHASPTCHPGLVPGSTRPQAMRPRLRGCRDKPGMTELGKHPTSSPVTPACAGVHQAAYDAPAAGWTPGQGRHDGRSPNLLPGTQRSLCMDIGTKPAVPDRRKSHHHRSR